MSEISGGNDSMDMSSETETGGAEAGGSVETSAISIAEAGSHTDLGAETSSQSVEGLVSGDEVSINSTETTHGMNQILETPETLELAHAQAQVESVHHSALESILEHNGSYISEQDHARIEAGVTSIKSMDNLGYGKTGGYHFDSKNSTIRVASLNETQRERSTIHETHHFASHNREIIVPMPDKGGYMVHNTVGTRQSSWFHSTRTGENSGYSERGRGLNEGITTMLTNRQLTEISPEKGKEAEQQQIYGHAVDLMASLEGLVGENTLKDAYFGGNMQGLENKVDSLAGPNEFGHLRDCLDRSISDNYAERIVATREAQEILARMAERSKAS